MGVSNYSNQILENLKSFQGDDFLCDTVIVVGQRSLKVHGAVLAAASPFFRAALKSNTDPGLHVITLSGCEFEVLESAVQFIYTGRLEVGTKYAESDKLTALLVSLGDLGLSLDHVQNCDVMKSNKEEEIPNSTQMKECQEAETEDFCYDREKKLKSTFGGHEGSSLKRLSNFEDCGMNESHDSSDSSDVIEGYHLQDEETFEVDSSMLSEVSNGWMLKNENGLHFLEVPADILAKADAGKCEDFVKLEPVSESASVNGIPSDPSFQDGHSMDNSVSKRMTPVEVVKCESQSADSLQDKGEAFTDFTSKTEEEDANTLQEVAAINTQPRKRQNLVCPTCGKGFGKVDHLTLHLRVHTGERPYTCSVCEKSFSSVNNLHRHMHSHTGNRRFLCHLCGRAFIQKTSLEDHITVHTKEKQYMCNLCGKFFKSAGCLRAHSKRHKYGPMPRKDLGHEEISDETQKLYQDSESVVIENGIARFVCKVCKKDYASKNSLAIHSLHHFATKPYVCKTCEKSFWQRAHLEVHERLHTGERPFSCDTCGKSFTYVTGLNIHVRLHTGEKPYKCEVCGSSYTQLAHLKSHVRTHTGEKPFECKACGKKYRNKVDLRFHVKRNPSCNGNYTMDCASEAQTDQ